MDLIHQFNGNYFIFIVFWYCVLRASATPLKSQYNYGNGPWNGNDNSDRGENSAEKLPGNSEINSFADTIVIPILTKPELEATFRKNRFVIFPMAFVSLQYFNPNL